MDPVLEELPVGAERSIWSFRYAKKRFVTPWHFHPQHELNFIERSRGTKFIGDFVGPYQEGELVLLRGRLPHCWKDQQDESSHCQSVVVQWNPGIYPNIPELAQVHRLMSKASKGLIFDRTIVEPIAASLRAFPDLKAGQLYVQLLQMLIVLSSQPHRILSVASFRHRLSDREGSRMAVVHNFVEAHYQRKITLLEVATEVNMSEQSFSRFFKKMMGRSFFAFLNEYRVNISCRLLIETEWTIQRISQASGYDSLPFFYKQFKKYKQMSPRNYRLQF
ncbi:MAG: AraC family transcriptional regulator [Bacteroidota bacterium]